MERDAEGPWSIDIETLRLWDRRWAEACERMACDPWRSGVLPLKFVELISVGISSACTSLNPEATRRHIRKALAAGATREDILFVLKCATVMAIHSCSLGAPILMEEAKALGVVPAPPSPTQTPACDQLKAMGQWNAAWDPFLQLSPAWTDAFMTAGVGVYENSPLSPKEIELLSIAFDASFTHMYAPGVRRHIHNALKAGASMAEVFEVLKICVAHGVQACNLGIPILADELARREETHED